MVQKVSDKSLVKTDIIRTAEELSEVMTELPVVQENKGLVDSTFFSGKYEPVVEAYAAEVGVTLTESEKKVIQEGFRKKSGGLLTAVPIKCSLRCPFKDNCPYCKIEKIPVGKSCPVERMLLDLYTRRYLDEFGVLVDSLTEVTMMTQLAATHIMEMRAYRVLANEEEATGLLQNVVGFNENEEPIVQTVEHPAFNLLERAQGLRFRLLDALVGTRKEQYKREAALKQKSTVGHAMIAADIKSKIDKLAMASVGD